MGNDTEAPLQGNSRERRTVLVFVDPAGREMRRHDLRTQSFLAERLAKLRGFDFGGDWSPHRAAGGPAYIVPNDTLDTATARSLGIRDEHDLFGGVAPFSFVATKTITHPLPDAASYAPPGWSVAFAARVRSVVLPGFSAFTRDDARAAALQLLPHGAVRAKMASGIGGSGQCVIADAGELADLIGELRDDELKESGVVLESNLQDVTTYSVGQVRVGALLATYVGTQHSTTNNHGHETYGGSRLTFVRGGFDALASVARDPHVAQAVAQAQTYHRAAMECFAGLFASRCNYDVARGLDSARRPRSGVLEQSWRIGGASAAEIAALEAFAADPALRTVRASTVEAYGGHAEAPAGAMVYFDGVDPEVGPLIKYALLEPYADT